MLNQESESLLSKLLFVGPAVVTLLVFTTGVTDPVNANKFLALGIFAFSSIAILGFAAYRFLWQQHRVIVLCVLGFLLASLNSLMHSNSPITQQIYGVYGRNNGLLLYFFLVIVFVSTLSMGKGTTARNVLISLLLAGGFNVIYCGWVLVFGDFIGWTNPYGNILGTFGNPNFVGAFLGMFSSCIVTLLIANFNKAKVVIPLLMLLGLTLIEIIKSHAIQGRVLFILGLVSNGFYLIRSRFMNRTPMAFFLSFSGIGGVLGLLGTLQIGPLAGMLYKESVSLRGEYWAAGINMGRNHLFSGVGFDSYGDWYRIARRASAIIKPGPETVSNASHNVIIDIFAFGGLPLMLFYVAILGAVISSIVKFTRRTKDFDQVFVALVCAWLCFQLQSIISINQVGLAVWGWVLGATIIAYERMSRIEAPSLIPSGKVNRKKIIRPQTVSPTLRAGIATAIGILIAVPPFAADVKWRSAQESLDAKQVEATLVPGYFNPQTSTKFLQIVGALEDSNLTELAHKYAIKSIEFNPRSYDGWRLFTLIRSATPDEKSIAIRKMKSLDPMNPNIGLK